MYASMSRWTLERPSWKSGWKLEERELGECVYAKSFLQSGENILRDLMDIERGVIPSFHDELDGMPLIAQSVYPFSC